MNENKKFALSVKQHCVLWRIRDWVWVEWIWDSKEDGDELITFIARHFLTLFCAAVEFLYYRILILKQDNNCEIRVEINTAMVGYQLSLSQSFKERMLCDMFHHPIVHFFHICYRVNLSLNHWTLYFSCELYRNTACLLQNEDSYMFSQAVRVFC